jgi:hypothetical protein
MKCYIQVFPFAILIDPQMRIIHMGHSIIDVFPTDTTISGRHLDDVFRLIRPDILLEWNKVRCHLSSSYERESKLSNTAYDLG